MDFCNIGKTKEETCSCSVVFHSLTRASITVMIKHYEKKELREERVYFILQVRIHYLGKSG